LSLLGGMLLLSRRYDEAAHPFDRAQELWKALADRHPREPGYRVGLAEAHQGRAFLAKQTGRLARAEQDYREAIRLWEGLGDAAPGERAGHLASCQSNLAEILGRLGKARAAALFARAALDTRREILAARPEDEHREAVAREQG